MENATKALMIAGAVLLAIMLISVGLLIFNSSNNQMSDAVSQMDQQAKDQFNNKFQAFEGRQSGSNVKTLITSVINNNIQNGPDNENVEEKVITVKVDKDEGSTSEQLEPIRRAIVSGRKYQVDVTVDAKTGLVHEITIKDLTGSKS